MIAILINRTWLDVDPNTRISFVVNNPAFDTEVLQGDYSYPFSLPATPTNNVALKFNNHPATANSEWISKTPCQVFDDGVKILEGEIYLDKYYNNSYECHINTGLSILNELSEKKLSELDWGPDIEITPVTGNKQFAVATYSGSAASGTLAVKIKAAALTIFTRAIAGSVNATLALIAADINAAGLDYTAVAATNTLTVTATFLGALPAITFTMDHVLPGGVTVVITSYKYAHHCLAEDWSAHMMDIVENLPAYTGYYGDPATPAVAFFPLRNDDSGIFDNSLGTPAPFTEFYVNAFQKDVSLVTNGKFILDPFGNDGICQTVITPYLYAFYVLDKILKQIFDNVTYLYYGYIENIISTLVLYNNRSVEHDDLDIDWVLNYLNGILPLTGYSYNYKNHVPDATVAEFLNAIKAITTITPFAKPAEKTVVLCELESLINSVETTDISANIVSLPEILKENPTGFKFTWAHDSSDSLISEFLKELDGKTVVSVFEIADLPTDYANDTIYYVSYTRKFYKPTVSVLYLYTIYLEFSGPYINFEQGTAPLTEIAMGCDQINEIRNEANPIASHSYSLFPYVKQKIQSRMNGTILDTTTPEPEPCSIRFLFNHGLQADGAGTPYPLGSSQNLLYDRTIVTSLQNEYHLSFYESEGPPAAKAIPFLYRDWNRFLSSAKQVNYDWLINHRSWNTLDITKHHIINGQKHIIKTINIDFPITAPARIETYQINP